MKVAILILAHKNSEQLRQVIERLKGDFAVFIHFDKRYELPDFLKEHDIMVAKKRYPSYWGSEYTHLAILELLKLAHQKNCDHFILISGQDLPLMSNKDILISIEKNPSDKLYHFKLPKQGLPLNGGSDRIRLYWDTKYNPQNVFTWAFNQILRYFAFAFRKVQQWLRLYRSVPFETYCGSLWFNLSREAVSYILEFTKQNSWYIRRFKFTRCADEIFFHTILLGFNYHLKHRIVNNDMRYIDWVTGPEYPRTFRLSDYERCVNSGKYFGRKFDEDVDADVIKKVLAHFE